MHNREIRSRSLMNSLPQDTGVALLQSGNDKQISCYINITVTFSISNLGHDPFLKFSRQLSFCLLYHHQAGSHDVGRVLFTREALFSQSLGNLGGCLGSRGGTRVFGDAEEQMLRGESQSRRHRLITQFSPPPNVRKPE